MGLLVELFNVGLLIISMSLVLFVPAFGTRRRRRFFLWQHLTTFIVCFFGWELWWSCGFGGGQSYTQRAFNESTNINATGPCSLQNTFNGFAMTSGDCAMMFFITVLSSLAVDARRICGCSSSSKEDRMTLLLEPVPRRPLHPRPALTVFLHLCGTVFLGVAQNTAVTLGLPNSVGTVGQAPLTPLPSRWGPIGPKVSVGNNIEWVLVPLIVWSVLALTQPAPANKEGLLDLSSDEEEVSSGALMPP